MPNIVKKLLGLFKPVAIVQAPVSVTVEASSLVVRLKELASQEDHLVRLFQDPVNKLYIFNTYSTSFEDLLRNIVNKDLERKITAISCHGYFKGNMGKLGISFNRLTSMLENGLKLNNMIEHDLYEIIDAYDYFDRF